GELSEPGRHDRQRKWTALRLAGSIQRHVEFFPQCLARRGARRLTERTVPGGSVRVPAKVPLAVEQHGRNAAREQLLDQVQCGGRLSAPRSAEECRMLHELVRVERDRGWRCAEGAAKDQCPCGCGRGWTRNRHLRRGLLPPGWRSNRWQWRDRRTRARC